MASRKYNRSYPVERRTLYWMRARCLNPNCEKYANYGGRGIKVCERWMRSFEAFYEDMGPRPSPKHSIDRIDNDGDYEPGNCRWATDDVQRWNKRSSRPLLEYDGRRMTVYEWAEVTGIHFGTIVTRVNRGWSMRDALTIPAGNGNRLRK
jgi:hypothetical protein